jgi:hypothetical protein
MTRRGRDRRRALGGMFGDPTAAMGRPGPSDPVWTTRSRFIVGDFAAARTTSGPRLFQWGPEGLAGRLGVTGGAFTPGQSSSGPLPSSSARSVDINPAGLRRSGSANAHPASCSRPSLPTASRWTLGGSSKVPAYRAKRSTGSSTPRVALSVATRPPPSPALERKPPFAGAFRVGPPGFEPGSHGL